MIYVQKDNSRDWPHHFDAASAMYGSFDMNGPDSVKLVSYDEVKSGKFDALIRTNLFVGSVEFMAEVFNRIGVTPEFSLLPDRPFYIMSAGQVRDAILADKKPRFVKSVKNKVLSGVLLELDWVSILNSVSDDTTLMVYEPLPRIISEWRIYVHRGQMIDSRNYSGDFKISPDYTYAMNKITKLKDTAPIAYTLDVGVLENGSTTTIEFNDMVHIGNYGIENTQYLSALRDRYFEIIRVKR